MPGDMADPSTTPASQESNHQPSQTENPNPQPNHLDLQPDSTQPPSSITTTQLPSNPNPNPNPSSAPPLVSPLRQHISPYGHRPPMGSSAAAFVPPGAPSFRPAGVPAPIPVPQFTPIPPNPNLLAYQTQPPGVSSPVPAPQQMYPGQLLNPALRPPYMAMPNGYMAPVPQGTMPPPVS